MQFSLSLLSRKGHEVPVRLVGIGYKLGLEGELLTLKVGHSHLDKVKIPNGITARLASTTKAIISGADLQRVTQFAAKIRSIKPPEPYNGKGIFIDDETIALKEGKKSNK
jgi:large subunit ribosomal protein L6